MKTLVPNIIAMSERELLAVIGNECVGTLITIDHTYLNYGDHYTFNKVTIYNEPGLALIAEKLKEFKLTQAAYCLDVELNQRRNTPSRLNCNLPIPEGRAYWWQKGDAA